VGLAQLVRLLVVKLTYSGLNPRFDMSVVFMANYSFSRRRRLVDSETLLMTDFMNLNIKPTQSFRSAHRGMMCIRVFKEMSDHMCMIMYICTMFLKKSS
jgi:hypothetical protein